MISSVARRGFERKRCGCRKGPAATIYDAICAPLRLNWASMVNRTAIPSCITLSRKTTPMDVVSAFTGYALHELRGDDMRETRLGIARQPL